MENNTTVATTEVENQVVAPAGDTTSAEQSTENTTSTETTSTEVTPKATQTPAEIAASYLRENGIEFNTIDDLKKKPEAIQPSYDKFLTKEDKDYFKFAEETNGGTREQFKALQTDLDSIPKIELARDQVRKDTAGSNFTEEEIDEYISDHLGIDIDDMSASDKIKLSAFTKDILKEKKEFQNKYKNISADDSAQTQPEKTSSKSEFVSRPDGSIMKKADYELLEKTRQENIANAIEAVNNVTVSNFKISIDDNGTAKEIDLSYEMSVEDKHNMVSMVTDVDAEMNRRYRSEKGFDNAGFGEDMQWSDRKFRQKAIASIAQKLIAQTTKSVLAQRGNFNFDPNAPLPSGLSGNTKTISVREALQSNGKYN